jgi:4-carboxymuconolactone decarboxylase
VTGLVPFLSRRKFEHAVWPVGAEPATRGRHRPGCQRAARGRRVAVAAKKASDELYDAERSPRASDGYRGVMEHLPAIYTRFSEAFPDIHAANEELARRCYEAGPLDTRHARLVKLALAIGAQADGAVRSHTRRGLDEGFSPAELRHVVALALTTIGFPHTVAALGWVEEVLESEGVSDG